MTPIINRTRKSWENMMTRVTNPNRNRSYRYIQRGITVCDRWRDYSLFLEDMGPRPEGTSLDRIDNDGNYEPINCKWSTLEEQQSNKSTNVFLAVNGETHTVRQWESIQGFNCVVIAVRLSRGWSPERAVLTPLRATKSTGHKRHVAR